MPPDAGDFDPLSPAVVVVGSAARDITGEDPRGWRLGGGVAYAALTLARLGLRTGAVMGLDAEARGATELDLLRRAGVQLIPVPLRHGPIFLNEETDAGRVQTTRQVSDLLSPTAVPDAWRAAHGWLFAPVANELDEAWADVPAAGALVALGWQGLLRVIGPGQRVRRRPPWRSALLSRSDLVGASLDDLPPHAAVQELDRLLGPAAELLLTDAHRGGLLFSGRTTGNRLIRYPAIPARRSVDPTGAGDVVLACMSAARLAERAEPAGRDWLASRRRHLRLAAAAASLVIERGGLLGVPEFASLRERFASSNAQPQPA